MTYFAAVACPASMGPRPFDRGNGDETKQAAVKSWLQWGRDLSIAEIGGRGFYGSRLQSFNGAATFRSRK